jgi:hypothetical protein
MKRDTVTAVLFACALALTAPTPYARSGHDDRAGTSAVTEDLTQPITPAIDTKPQRIETLLTPTTGDLRGHLKYVYRPLRQRHDLTITVKARFGEKLRPDNAEHTILIASFPDGSTCTLDFDHRVNNVAEFKLELRQRRKIYVELHGNCDVRHLPDFTGGQVQISYDDDSEPLTPNATVLSGSVD